MKIILVCLAAISQIALSAFAEPIQKIPLYYKRRSSKSDFVSAASKELQNGMFGGVVQIGNPPQNFTLAFDTTVGFTWVRSTQCVDENCEGRCAFNSVDSTTIISTSQSFNLDYGDATVNTTIYLDTFRFADLTVKNMPFGSAYNMVGFDEGFDGFLGLGREVILNKSATHYAKRDIPASGFVPNAYQQNYGLQSAQFGMYTTSTGSGFSDSGSVASTSAPTSPIAANSSAVPFSPAVPYAPSVQPASSQQNTGVTSGGYGVVKRHYHDEQPAGYLVVGGVDTDAIKGKLHHIKVVDDNGSGNWAVPVHQAGFVDDLHFKVCKMAKAVLSSSTDVIGLPDKQADEFKKHWFAEYDEDDNTYKIPCCLADRLSSFQIQLGDIRVTLPPHYWSHRRDVDSCCEMCRTHIGRSDSSTDYLIGSAFTNAFYTQYDSDEERISLALKKCHKSDGLKLCDLSNKDK